MTDDLETIYERFEAAWARGETPDIPQFLPSADDKRRRDALRELIRLDLEFRWRKASNDTTAAIIKPRSLRDYCEQFPELTTEELIDSGLMLEEYRVRQRWGDAPSEEEFAREFNVPIEKIRSQLESVHGELAGEETVTQAVATNDETATHGSGSPGNRQTSVEIEVTGEPAAEGRFGNYDLLSEIARGGMGVVYKARQRKLNRVVALKMIKSGQLASSDEVKRFYTEAEAAARLDHPAIVPVYDVGQHDDRHFFTMGFVDGESLQEKLKPGPLAPREAADLLRQIAEGVEYAHRHGIVHRDLKPANVLIERDGQPRITDFGLAKNTEVDSGLTATGQVMGTPSYMPPEQAAGRVSEIGPVSDVYSLGALLYALLTGRPPFQAASVMETLKQVADQEPVPPRQLNPAVDRDLETISLKCLQKEPAKRYAGAAELSKDLRRFLNGEPIQARPVTWAERGWRWTRRHPARAGLITVGLLAVLALVGLGVALNFQEQLEGKNEQLETANQEVSAARDELEDKNTRLGESLAKEEQLRSQLAVKKEEVEQLLNIRRIKGAFEEWKDHEIPRALKLLSDCPPQRRHWEWHYVKQLCDTGRLTFRKHTSPVRCIAVSPDGKHVISGDGMGNVKLWEAETGREVRALPRHHGAAFQVSFNRDGTRFATTATDSVRVWNAKNGRVIRQLPGGSRSVSLSPDGKRVAALERFRTVKIWDVDSGKELVTLKQQPRGIGGVVFSPDGKRLATISTRGFRTPNHVWNAATGELQLTLNGHDDYVSALAFRPDGKQIATAGRDRTIKVWDAASGRALLTLRGHQDDIEQIAFRRDGRQIVSCSRDKSIKVWDAVKGLELLTLRGHTGVVAGVAFSPDGRQVISGSWDKTVRVWDATRPQTMNIVDAHSRNISAAVWTPDGKQIVTTGRDRAVQFRDPLTGRLLRSVQPQAGLIRRLAISSDGKRFATLGSDGVVRVWNANFQRPLLEIPGRAAGMAFSPKGDRLALAVGNELRVVDATNGRVVSTFRGHDNKVFHLAFSPDGRRVVSAARATNDVDGNSKLWDETVKVWNADDGRDLLTLKGNRRNEVSDVVFSRDGSRIAAANWDGAARVWDANDGRHLLSLEGHAGFVHGVAFSPDGKRIATVGDDDTLRIWDAATGRELLTFKDNRLSDDEVAFSPDGRLILTRGPRVHIRDAGVSPKPPAE